MDPGQALAARIASSVRMRCPAVAAIYHAIFNLIGVVLFGIIAYGAEQKLIEAWPDLKFGVEGDFTMFVWPLRVPSPGDSLFFLPKFVTEVVGGKVFHPGRLVPSPLVRVLLGFYY